jgi:hypothetical protein
MRLGKEEKIEKWGLKSLKNNKKVKMTIIIA